MHKIDAVELEFLYLAASRKNGFDEKDIAESEIAQLGVGRVLDRLATLKERGLLETGHDGSFLITDAGRQIFWGENTLTETKILRLLKIKSLKVPDVARYLLEPEHHISEEIERLRVGGFVMFTTVRRADRIERVCEIMQEGLDLLDRQPTDSGYTTIQNLLTKIADKTQSIKDEQKLRLVTEELRNILKQM